MKLKHILIFLGSMTYVSFLMASTEPAKEPDKTKLPFPVRPLPRHIFMPELAIGKEPPVLRSKNIIHFSEHRYWLIIMLGSWSQKSAEITILLNTYANVFQQRDISILALFAQDTKESVKNWVDINHPFFTTAFASRDFLDAMKTPKVPSIWFIGRRGELLHSLELPSLNSVQDLINRALILTDF